MTSVSPALQAMIDPDSLRPAPKSPGWEETRRRRGLLGYDQSNHPNGNKIDPDQHRQKIDFTFAALLISRGAFEFGMSATKVRHVVVSAALFAAILSGHSLRADQLLLAKHRGRTELPDLRGRQDRYLATALDLACQEVRERQP